MNRIITVITAVLLITGAFSCKKSSSGGSNNTPTTKTVVIKITLSPVPGSNQGSFTGACNALLPNQNFATWKVNGVVRSSENTIAFTASDFQNGALTLETTAAVTSANLSMSGVTTAQYPFTVVYTATVNGKANDPVTIPVTSTMTRSFSL